MPRLPETYPARFDLRLTEEQNEQIRKAAELAGQSLSDWVRGTLVRQARKEIREAEK